MIARASGSTDSVPLAAETHDVMPAAPMTPTGIVQPPITATTISEPQRPFDGKVAAPAVKDAELALAHVSPAHTGTDATVATATDGAKPPGDQTAIEPASARPTLGALAINAKPPCLVAVDGTPTGRHTPLSNLKLASGTHHVTLTNDEYAITETIVIEIVGGKETRLTEDYSARVHPVDPNGTINPFGNRHP